MPAIDTEFAASPFDSIAPTYDSVFTDTPVGQAQRSVVWAELVRSFHLGDRVLEIGCGTGVDACFLAERGVSVLACDQSQAMTRVASGRVCENSSRFRDASVAIHTWTAEQIGNFAAGRNLDGAFSNFGVLNCVENMQDFSTQLSSCLKPGAPLLICLMGPCCLWEVGWFLAHGDLHRATRRFQRRGVEARLGEGTAVRVYYPTVQSLKKAFAPHFRLKNVKGIGVSVPPSYAAGWAHRYPRPWNVLVHMDRWLAGVPGFRVVADHVLLTFEKVGP